MLLETRIPLRYVLKKVRRDLVFVLLICTLVELAIHYQRAILPTIPTAIPAFLGTAISLLLSFKLNQSYDRWWEARKVWGAIVNDSRTFVRQLLSFGGQHPDTVRTLGRRQIAWCYALGQSLRGLDWKVGAAELLDEDEIQQTSGHANKPLFLLQLHARDVTALADAGQLTDYQRIALDDTLTRLTDSMGKAERIRGTVFPRTYRAFLHAFIYLFITALSIALAEVEGFWQIAITTSISVPFFLLEKTASHMQDPFANRPTDTSVTAIARTIHINLAQLLGEEDVPAPLASQGFYIM
ncbi:MAG: bestrophin family ion channel [Sandaracinaceae bacterium]|nr:MAG: hypothetical protein EVA89_09765 [Sandaracinaceae bacterium]